VGSNLTHAQQRTCDKIRSNKNYKAWASDKNLVPVFCGTTQYTRRGVTDHLGDERTYKRMTANEANVRMIRMRYAYQGFLMKHNDALSEEETTFLHSSLRKCEKKIARFYLTAKIHKTPWATRPVVSTSGTMMAGLSKWVDHWLQKLRHLIPTYLQDTSHLLSLLRETGKLPHGARLFTADANSMYTNVDTEHGIQTISNFLDDHKEELPHDFPIKAVKAALRLVMTNNVFEFGDSFFEQLCGCAMGTPVACIYATIYYAYHEKKRLLTRYSNNLLMMRRFIDDIFGIWVPNGDPDAWSNFERDLPFGILTWKLEDRAPSVDFLDLTITINADRRIETRTFQKVMNLYLYIPPHSAHSPSVIRGMTYGLLRKYHEQNTHREDYIELTVLLFRRLRARGWDAGLLKSIFNDASAKVETPHPSKTQERNDNDEEKRKQRLFIHAEYHPNGILRKELRIAFKATFGNAFQDLETEKRVI
jgi:hypothetical protein